MLENVENDTNGVTEALYCLGCAAYWYMGNTCFETIF